MHTLEPECLEMHAAGLVDDLAASRAVALERGEIFPVHGEIRFALYAAVAAITSGIGILLKANFDRIGPLSLMIGLAIVAALCYATAIRTHLRHETRSIGGDYVLLLGALIVSADLGYAESQFHWLGPYWSWHLLILATIHALAAYALDSRLVLSVSLTALAAWFGIDAHANTLLRQDGSLRDSGAQALVCGAAILGWRELHRRLGGRAAFEEVFEHFAANVAFWGALALTFGDGSRLAGAAALLAIAALTIAKGLRQRQEPFVVYGVGYTALGLCYLAARFAGDGLPAAVLCLVIVTGAAILLWRFHAQIRAAAT